MNIELTGFATVSADVTTVADLIEFAQFLQDKNIDPESEIDSGSTRIWVDLSVHDIDWIECGEHIPVKKANGEWQSWSDVVLTTHGHEESERG